jgi:hypothetical protein
MTRRPLLALLAALLLAPAALGGNPFDVGTKPADHACVTATEVPPPDIGPTSPMLDQLRGILSRLDKQQLLDLRASAGGTGSPVDPPATARRLCVIHVSQGAQTKHVEILRDAGGVYFAQELLPEGLSGPAVTKPGAIRLNQSKFARVISSWPAYRAEFKVPKDSPKSGEVAPLPRPYTPGWFIIDQDLMGERFHGGQHTDLQVPGRDLSAEALLVRLPANYNPRTAYGVIVYIDPGEKADIYPPFQPGADEQGFILVAAVNTGNNVHRATRYQLALDALATVTQRYLTDPRRIYVAGISGGGQVATHLWLCFPEVFTGAIPIVALASYKNIPADMGKYWAATISKPTPALFKLAQAHRCAAMTGGGDMNEKIIQDAAKVLKQDGFNIRVFDYPDMGHTAPTAPRFAEALSWVDEPYRTIRDKEAKAAEEALKKVTSANPTLTDQARKTALVEVTRLGPWTPAAWRAAEMLEAVPPAP